MAHDDDYDANDNDVGPKGVKGGRRRGKKERKNERTNERTKERRRRRKEEITEESNFRYRLPGVPLKLRARRRGGDPGDNINHLRMNDDAERIKIQPDNSR